MNKKRNTTTDMELWITMDKVGLAVLDEDFSEDSMPGIWVICSLLFLVEVWVVEAVGRVFELMWVKISR